MHNPYFPIPFSPGLLQGSADAKFPQLTPRITLADGSVLLPLAFFTDVKVDRRGRTTEVSWRQAAMDLMGGEDAKPDDRASIETHYVLAPGAITRTDRLLPAPGVRIRSIETEFATFSATPRSAGSSDVRFGSGEVQRFSASGYGACRPDIAGDPVYRAPTGAFSTVIRCGRTDPDVSKPLELSWTLSYKSATTR